MSPRVAGAALALLAAMLLVASVAGIPAAWWTGSPLKNGTAMHKKDVTVTLFSAVGCNSGGDGRCEPLETDPIFDAIRYTELGSSGLLVLMCMVLAGTTLATSERRKTFGKLVIVVALLCGAISAALIFLPKMKNAGVTLPIGPGMFVFFGGVALAILGSVIAMRPTPKLTLQPPRQSFAPSLAAPPSAQPVDVLAMLLPEPAARNEPSRPPPSPGGQLAGPAGPLAPPSFGAVPTEPPFVGQPPTQLPPTPMLAPFSARPGGPPLATPPPPGDRPRSGTGAPPLPDRSKASSQMPAIPGDRSKASNQMPAIPGDRFKASGSGPSLPGVERPKSTSAPPFPGSVDRSKGSGNVPAIPEARAKGASDPPPIADARTKAASIAPPSAAARTKAASIAPPTGDVRPKSPSVAPVPSTVAGMMPPTRPTGSGLPPPRAKGPSVPPPAGAPKKPTTVSAVVPPPMLPMRVETDPSDMLETMDRDAMTIARDGTPSGDNTDASVALPDIGPADESTDVVALPPMPRDSASDIQTSMQRKLTPSELVRTVARESQSEIETIAREKISARDLAIGDSTNPVIIPGAGRTSAKEIAELGEAPTARATTAVPPGPATTPAPRKITVSTAPESLPPPKKEAAPASGPTPACPQCEAPMAWVEEHLRFYCKSCRMYF